MSIKRINVGARMSSAVVHGDTVYLAGLTADDAKADVKVQTKQILDKVDKCPYEAGIAPEAELSRVAPTPREQASAAARERQHVVLPRRHVRNVLVLEGLHQFEAVLFENPTECNRVGVLGSIGQSSPKLPVVVQTAGVDASLPAGGVPRRQGDVRESARHRQDDRARWQRD